MIALLVGRLRATVGELAPQRSPRGGLRPPEAARQQHRDRHDLDSAEPHQRGQDRRAQAACARRSAAMSILRICNIERMTRCAVSEFPS
ncbi:MAG TPA: hypothetical protein VLK58_02060, partial [Conexibacter sp.]|nr:hypothetical protein [Conexibacter sp.]